jgi:hypothetical protein
MHRTVRAAGLLLGLMLLPSGPSFAKCGDEPGDAVQVANTRTLTGRQCDGDEQGCTSAPTHRKYVGCIKRQVTAAVDRGDLRKACRREVVGAAARSTCALPGAVTCCLPAPRAGTKCTVENSGAACLDRGGCVRNAVSCANACEPAGCDCIPPGQSCDPQSPADCCSQSCGVYKDTPVCGPICGDGVCSGEVGEGYATCAVDCAASCGHPGVGTCENGPWECCTDTCCLPGGSCGDFDVPTCVCARPGLHCFVDADCCSNVCDLASERCQ